VGKRADLDRTVQSMTPRSEPATATLDVVRRYHRAWTSKQFGQAGRCLAPDLETQVPLNTYESTEQFLEALAGFGRLVSKVELLAELGDGNEAMLLYDMDVEAIGTMRVAEHFTVADGRITRIRHVHDTAQLRAAGLAG
jgi:ketosteroid isomerase-like protein